MSELKSVSLSNPQNVFRSFSQQCNGEDIPFHAQFRLCVTYFRTLHLVYSLDGRNLPRVYTQLKQPLYQQPSLTFPHNVVCPVQSICDILRYASV